MYVLSGGEAGAGRSGGDVGHTKPIKRETADWDGEVGGGAEPLRASGDLGPVCIVGDMGPNE